MTKKYITCLGLTALSVFLSSCNLLTPNSQKDPDLSGMIQQPIEGAKTSDTYEPWVHGYRFVDILNWEASTDDYSEELRAHVPLQERNEAFAATQANPLLTLDAQVYNVAMGNYRATGTNSDAWNGAQYYDDFSYNLFKFWQYTDYIGAGGRPTSGFSEEYWKETDKLEYGIVAIPIAATTNTAHKNGVMSLGEYFIPRDPQYTEEWLYKDENGNFPYAQKLIDIMNYYGFDGYFINQEGAFDSKLIPVFKEMIAWMTQNGCYIQWYDAINPQGDVSYQNELNATNSQWLTDEEIGSVSNSMWLNYWWNRTKIENSVEYAKSLSLNPYTSLFLGIECGMGRFVGGELYSSGVCRSEATVEYLDWVLDDTGNPMMSLALWGGDFTQDGYAQEDNLRFTQGYQWAAEERERMWYTSPLESVVNHATIGIDRSDVDVSGEIVWQGLSKYVAERSAINGTVFNTNFNTGHGMQYYLNGEVSRDMEWSNLNLQDFMPTWQWWIETKGNALHMDWDYGAKQEKILADGSSSTFDFTQIGAYNGGSSLVIYGDLQKNISQTIHLYKTDLQVTQNSSISLTYTQMAPSAEESLVSLMLTFKDAPDSPVLLPLTNSKGNTNWATDTIDLNDFVGKEIAAISIQILASENISDYQLNLGNLSLSDGINHAPTAPKKFVVDKVFDETKEIVLKWTLEEDYDKVKLYHIYAVYNDGTEKFVTGAYSDCMYISALENYDAVVGFKLCAVGADGSESTGAFTALSVENSVSNIQVLNQDQTLLIQWNAPTSAIQYDEIEISLEWWYSDREKIEPISVKKGLNQATLNVGLEDGSKYILYLTLKGEEEHTICYFGQLQDHYCAPYDGELRISSSGRHFSLTLPEQEDWYAMYVNTGSEENSYGRTWGDPYNIKIPLNCETVTVTLHDRYGNKAEAVVFTLPSKK